jgi:Putative zinc-finger
MTEPLIIDRERLAAFADGELSPEDAAAVVMHLADHPEDQAFVDEVMAANIALARAFQAPLHEPVPDRFIALILPEEAVQEPSAKVLPFHAKAKLPLWGAGVIGAGMAVAAALVTVAVLPRVTPDLSVGPVAAGSAFHQILTTTPSGQVVNLGTSGNLTILASLPATDGFCREFEIITQKLQQLQVGLACRAGGEWTVDVLLAEAIASAPTASDGYVPAAGDGFLAIEAWLERRGAGLTLSPAEEAAAIAQRWMQ